MDVIGIAATLYRKRGMKAMLFHLTTDDHINFGSGKTSVPPEAKPGLDQIASQLSSRVRRS